MHLLNESELTVDVIFILMDIILNSNTWVIFIDSNIGPIRLKKSGPTDFLMAFIAFFIEGMLSGHLRDLPTDAVAPRQLVRDANVANCHRCPDRLLGIQGAR